MDILSVIVVLCALVALASPVWLCYVNKADEESYTDRLDIHVIANTVLELRRNDSTETIVLVWRNPRQYYLNSYGLIP